MVQSMEESEKKIYKFGLLSYTIIAIIFVIYALILGYFGESSVRQDIIRPTFFAPFVGFAIGIFIPATISKNQVKHSSLIALGGSIIFILFTHYITPMIGTLLEIEPTFGSLLEDISIMSFASLSAWGIISVLILGLMGTILSPFKQIEISVKDTKQEKTKKIPMLKKKTVSSEEKTGTSQGSRLESLTDESRTEKQEEEELGEEESFEEDEETKPCPDCDGEVKWLSEYRRWYCQECKEYKSFDD